MFFSCEKDLLLEGISTVQKAAASRSALPALEGILFRAEGERLTVTGYDLDLGIESVIDASISKEGSIVINAKMIGDIIRKMPSGLITLSVGDNYLINIKGGRAEFNLVGLDSKEFPDLPFVEGEKKFSLPQSVLKSMIRQTIFAVSQNESNPIYTGSLFELKDGFLNVVSIDGYRLALRREKAEGEDMSFVVPAKTLSEVSKIIKDDEEGDVSIVLTKKHIVFLIDKFKVVSRLLEGEFINYDNAIPNSNTISVTVDAQELMSCVERTSLLVQEKIKSPLVVKADKDGGIMSLSCNTSIGNAYDEILCEIDGGEIEIGFNHRYLHDALKACETEKVKIKLSSPLSPCVICPTEGDDFIMLVLPVRLKN